MKKETWNSQLGVILAVAGSAVGLGNFLKFPGQVALYGGAAFMIAYVLSFCFLGLPVAFVEWTVGRYGGARGYYSPAGLMACLCGSKKGAYLGIFGVVLTLIIYCYYVYIESWCLGYAYGFLAGHLNFEAVESAAAYFATFVGAGADGSAFRWGSDGVIIFWVFSFALNFFLIYRGVSKGIELFCKYAMPLLVLIAIVIVIRMMTLGAVSPEYPERTISQGMGFMWNPVKVVLEEQNSDGVFVEKQRLVGEIEIQKAAESVEKSRQTPSEFSSELQIREISVFEQLRNPSIWIAAAGQVFFSLTVGFGAIMAYASHLRRRDDINLSCLTSAAANEFCEVCLGGLITVPAAVAFFGVSGVMGAGLSLFDLGFKVLPMFFTSIPFGWVFGFLFFFLLFLAAVTSSLSMLQPSISFIEEAVRANRKFSTLLMGLITFFISGFVVYFSKDLKAMDTFDFWMGQVTVYVFAMTIALIFAWSFGVKKGIDEANVGSSIKIPYFCAPIIKYVTPLILFVVFSAWLAKDVFGVLGDGNFSPYILDLFGGEGLVNKVAWGSIIIIVTLFFFFFAILASSKRYKNFEIKED